MKKIIKSSALIAAMAIGSASFAQLQDEQDVTMTMDLQPILQLKMEGPNQIDFTFDEINKYYTGVVKTGANILKVSASVSFDLWAVGVSTGQVGNFLWDNQVNYGSQAAAANALNKIGLTALELHQWPANPVSTSAIACAPFTAINSDYSQQFTPYVFTTNQFAAGLGNNSIYCSNPNGAYLPPLSTATTATEKYIAGASTTATGCSINAGSYLFGSVANSTASPLTAVSTTTNSNAQQLGGQTIGGYYFVMDYRILPGLPARFPSTKPANLANSTSLSVVEANTESGLNAAGTDLFAAPGVYTMYVKYILSEDL